MMSIKTKGIIYNKQQILNTLTRIKQEVTHLYILDQFTTDDYEAITRHINIIIKIIRRSEACFS